MLGKSAFLPELPIASRRALASLLDQAASPEERGRIHCAVEAFPYRLSTLRPVGYDDAQGLQDFLSNMSAFGWAPILEDNVMVGVRRGKATLALHLGSQLNISCTQASTLHETAAELDLIIDEINQIGSELDIGFLGMGFHPTARHDEIPEPPGARFRVTHDVLSQRPDNIANILRRSCAMRVTVSYANEQDMVKKLRIIAALQPMVTALFACSPFIEGQLTPYKSSRMHALTRIDNGDNSLLSLIFSDDFGFDSLAQWAANHPLLYIKRDGRIHAGNTHSFGDFLDGKHPDFENHTPVVGDWEVHLKTLPTDICVHLTHGLTLQCADAGSLEMGLALSAFWAGILYDQTALDNALGLIKHWKTDELSQLRLDAPVLGLSSEINGVKIFDIAQQVLKYAMQGLRRRAIRLYGGPDESRYLEILLDYAESGQSRADSLFHQEQFYTDFSLKSVFDSCRLQSAPRSVTPLT